MGQGLFQPALVLERVAEIEMGLGARGPKLQDAAVCAATITMAGSATIMMAGEAPRQARME